MAAVDVDASLRDAFDYMPDVNVDFARLLAPFLLRSTLWPATATFPLTDIWPAFSDFRLRTNGTVATLLGAISNPVLPRQVVLPSGQVRDAGRENILYATGSPSDAFKNAGLVGGFDMGIHVVYPHTMPASLERHRGPFLPFNFAPTCLNLAPSGYGRFIDPHLHAGVHILIGQILGSAVWMTWPRTPHNQAFINRHRPLALTPAVLQDVMAADGLRGLTIGRVSTTRAFVVSPDEIVAVFAATSTMFLSVDLFSCRRGGGLQVMLDTVLGLGNTAGLERKLVLDSVRHWRDQQKGYSVAQGHLWRRIEEAMELFQV